jgi:4,5-DOPA dioxygenase extradiol
MSINNPDNIPASFLTHAKMPVLFVGHGNPMNAIEENQFVEGWRKTAASIPKPEAILCISAHWETRGSAVTGAEKPSTIHDFGGFPEALYKVQYPAPGSPELARQICTEIRKTRVSIDQTRGLDHGCWSVICKMYPDADIPIVQLSIDHDQNPLFHYELAKELSPLRLQRILIVGSGNLVHNLRLTAWEKLNEEYGFDWATEANEKMKHFILQDNHQALINYKNQGKNFDLAIPTPEHFLPLLYVLALKQETDTISFFNDKPVAGSLTMTCVKLDST